MHPQDHHVEDFLAAVRRRKNRHRLWNTMLWAVIAGAALLVVVGLCYVFRGYAVPSQWIGSIVCAVVLCSVAVWLMRRLNIERAAEYTDRFFGLQDSVSSYLHFSRARLPRRLLCTASPADRGSGCWARYGQDPLRAAAPSVLHRRRVARSSDSCQHVADER